MGLKEGELKNTVLRDISIDEFEPKTGDIADVVVVGFYTLDQLPGEDLYGFVSNSGIEFRDVELSPNPNPDGYYMLFVEFDRDEQLLSKIKQLADDITRVTGQLQWQASTHLTDNFYALDDEQLQQYLITDPTQYVTRDEFEEQQQGNLMNEGISQLLVNSGLLNISINKNKINLNGARDSAKLEIVAFGEASKVMAQLGINESAIAQEDSVFRKFNQMLGENSAIKINEYIIIFHPNQSNILVTREC